MSKSVLYHVEYNVPRRTILAKIMFHVEQYIKLGSKNSHSSTIMIYEYMIVKPYLLYEKGGDYNGKG